jgi:hypothetical protein
VLDLARLHARARVALGLTRQEPELCAGVPCRQCDAAALYRKPGDDAVNCGRCGLYYSARDYADWVSLNSSAVCGRRNGEWWCGLFRGHVGGCEPAARGRAA